jgi:hypothetical protein
VISGPFFKKNQIKDFINTKKYYSFSGEVKNSVIFLFFFLLHKRAKPIYSTPNVTYEKKFTTGKISETINVK